MARLIAFARIVVPAAMAARFLAGAIDLPTPPHLSHLAPQTLTLPHDTHEPLPLKPRRSSGFGGGGFKRVILATAKSG